MSNHAEALAGMPSGRGGGGGGRRGGTPPTPEQIAARDAAAKATAEWRKSATEATFKPVRQKIADAGIELRLLCYNMSDLRTLPDGRVTGTTDDEIEYGFMMAKWLGVEAMSTSTQVSMAKRIAPFADKHKMMVGFHGHANTKDTNEVATPETFDAVMAASKYHGANLDIGHYTEAGYDPVAFIAEEPRAHHEHAPEGQEEGRPTAAPTARGAPATRRSRTSSSSCRRTSTSSRTTSSSSTEGDPVVEVTKCLQLCKEMLA